MAIKTYQIDEVQPAVIAAVKHEIEQIRVFATLVQLARLSFAKLEPDDIDFCIYGQLTGLCYSPEATRLINKCTLKLSFPSFDSSKPIKVSVPNYEDMHEPWDRRLTPLEWFIVRVPAYNANIIAYLKSEHTGLIF